MDRRLDPAALPAAGKSLRHDSANEDYRYTLSTVTSPHKRLQWNQWGSGPTEEHLRHVRHIEPLTVPPNTKALPNRPDLYNVSDIQAASPAVRPGLTLIVPHLPSSISNSPVSSPSAAPRLSPSHSLTPASTCSPSQLQPLAASSYCYSPTYSSASAGGDCSPSGRCTNPLQPHYILPGTGGGGARPYPTAKRGLEPNEWRNTSPVRTRALDTSDISGAVAQPLTRARKDNAYSSFEYSDVTGPTSPLRARMLKEGREQLAPVETGRKLRH